MDMLAVAATLIHELHSSAPRPHAHMMPSTFFFLDRLSQVELNGTTSVDQRYLQRSIGRRSRLHRRPAPDLLICI